MLLLGFLIGATGLNLALGFLVQFKSYRAGMRLALLSLSGLLTAYLWTGWFSAFSPDIGRWFLLQKVLMVLGLLASVGQLLLTREFLQGSHNEPRWKVGKWDITLSGVAAAGAALGCVSVFWPGRFVMAGDPGDASVHIEGAAVLAPVAWILVAVYTLYLLEGTYRYARDYQRRIGRLCFIGLGVLTVFHIAYLARVLLYRTLPPHFAEATSVVYGVVYPVILTGFLRYRLGSEHIAVPRGTVYTSATIFLTGAAFLGVAMAALTVQWLDMEVRYFERFLLVFSVCFLAVLVIGSGSMRRHVVRFVDRQLYSRKYDYQEQFFLLHRTMLAGADVRSAIVELVENMKYSVSVGDAYFFELNWHDGNFYQHENKEEATRRGMSLEGDGAAARQLTREKLPVDLLGDREAERESREAIAAEPAVKELDLDAVFPVFVGDRLTGILALQGGRSRPFDQEDLALIEVFTKSIGDVLFKSRVQQERIERKQFESFHHLSAFIIHDIKNQVATLNLLMKNAERNLSNPSFQTSMMSSIRSCADNLQGLIDRLSVAPRQEAAAPLARHPLKPLLEEVAANSGLASLAGVEFKLDGPAEAEALMDRQALFFVVRNLVNNSLEAMRGRGRLAVSCGALEGPAPTRLRGLFGGGEQFFAGFGAYVLVEDSGPGMDPAFVRTRLFQPFATTKEKGVGVGLYQSKTMVERMGGRILCHSEPGKGTEFCILLPGADRRGQPRA